MADVGKVLAIMWNCSCSYKFDKHFINGWIAIKSLYCYSSNSILIVHLFQYRYNAPSTGFYNSLFITYKLMAYSTVILSQWTWIGYSIP